MSESLPRRPILGVVLARDAFAPDGVTLGSVVDGGTASDAGLCAGDRIVAIDGVLPRSIDEIRDALRRDTIDVAYVREGTERSACMRVRRMPLDPAVRYGELDVGRVRLRTLVDGDGDVGILYLQGIACASIEDDPVARLAKIWALQGMSVLRFDKRGCGDSEGAPCSELDFDTEVEDARAALALLRATCREVFLFGHSVGGMIAPLVADEGVRGVVVYGTSSSRWTECLDASTRRQLELRGRGEDEIRRVLLREREERSNGLHGGRSPAFHRQLDRSVLPPVWARLGIPVLALHGEWDWVVGEDEARALAAQARGDAGIVPGVDHLFGRHASLADSLAEYGRGAPGDEVATRAAAWIGTVLSQG